MSLNIQEAMDPADIEWCNMGMGFTERMVRDKLGLAMDVWLLALWSVPVAAITTACEPATVAEYIPFLEPVVLNPSGTYTSNPHTAVIPSLIDCACVCSQGRDGWHAALDHPHTVLEQTAGGATLDFSVPGYPDKVRDRSLHDGQVFLLPRL
jgi:hypothetical protein